MKIAVVGAGFCGLALCWHLSRNAHVKITLFDAKGIGAGASGVPVGLLHTYAGPKALMSWKGQEAYPETVALLEVASEALGKKIYFKKGILRPQIAGMDFSFAKNRPDTEWWEPEVCQKEVPELLPLPGLFIRSGVIVDCPGYVAGLWRAVQLRGVDYVQQAVEHPEALTGYDLILFTVGSGQTKLKGISAPQVSLIKGQTLELEWQKETPLPFALNASVQISQIDAKKVFAGATFERRWSVEGPDAGCEEEIRNKIAKMAPEFAKLPLQAIWTGFRAATADKKPFIAKCAPNVYLLGGMGSKGLLYHAWLAKSLARDVLGDAEHA